MPSRLTRTLVLLGCAWAGVPEVAAALDVQMFPLTGELRLKNTGSAPITFVLYSIRSPSGALNSSPPVWKSITDNYDVSGNKFIDPNHDWLKLSASSTELSEGVVDGPGGVLPGMRSVSLGRVWNPHRVPNPDLLFDFRAPNGQPISTFGSLSLDGDFLADGVVNQSDYSFVWRPNFGSTSMLLADGNINGRVDAADYVVWRDNLGRTRPSPPFGAGVGTAAPSPGTHTSAVPEPAISTLLLLASAGLAPRRFRRHGRHLRGNFQSRSRCAERRIFPAKSS